MCIIAEVEKGKEATENYKLMIKISFEKEKKV